MNDLDEEKNNNHGFDENDFDPTKDAFFSDLGNMEEEIASEAYELVAHALSLIESEYYDDSIEILRQAIGLYEQINRKAEIEALLGKISDIYVLKEKSFKESELEAEDGLMSIDQPSSEKLSDQAQYIILEANQLVEKENFESALDKYDEAINIFQSINNHAEIEVINKLVEDCYNKKAEFLRRQKKVEVESQTTLNEDQIKAERLRAFQEAKIKESQLSKDAFDLIGRATDFAKIHQYDEAIQLYEQGATLFQEINWDNESKKILSTIEQVKIERDNYLIEIEKIQKEAEIQEKIQTQKEGELLEKVRIEEEMKLQAEAKKLKELYEKRREEEEFKKQITEMVNTAEKLAREYDLRIKKEIRKKVLISKCIYPEVIKIYEEVRNKVNERGWNEEAMIYTRQVNHYNELLEKDKKLREIEAQKAKKEKEYEEMLKVKSEKIIPKEVIVKQRLEKESPEIDYKKQIAEIINLAEKMARNYEIAFKKAIKKGDLAIESKYPIIIDFYTQAKNLAIKKGWNQEAAIYTSQINKFTDLLEKENRVREIEAKKSVEKKEFEKVFKVKESSAVDFEKLQSIEMQKKEVKEFQKEITELVDKAEKMARDYEIAMKKAIKEGNLLDESPYPEIIKIYNVIREKVYTKGWQDQVSIYTNQIKIYQDKMKSDLKLREIEANKIEKERQFEELQKTKKIQKLSSLDSDKLKKMEEKLIQEKIEKKFQLEIDQMIDNAEKLARDYELAIKKGEFEKECPYEEIIDLYEEIRKKVYARGWQDQAEIYSNQIKLYTKKLEKDKQLRLLEDQKIKKEREFEELLKVKKKEKITSLDIDKLKIKEEKLTKEKLDEQFELEIDQVVDENEKLARNYELAIKKGQFEKECPYQEIIDSYQEIRKKVYARGWQEEAEIYTNQIKLYMEKLEKDKRLRELEAQKAEKQKEFEESLKVTKKPEHYKELQISERKELETEEFLNTAMNYINDAENSVRSYELSMKKDILIYKSPYDDAISNYEKARDIFKKIGWINEANRLLNTINFYRDKKIKDNELREIEKQKAEEAKLAKVPSYIPSEEHLEKERKIIEFEKIKKEKTKEAEEILNLINKAEKMAQDYEIQKKEGILKVKAPFKEIIEIYRSAKKGFEGIGWTEQANQLVNSINHYKERLDADKRLRNLELEKVKKEEVEIQKQKYEAKLAREAEAELLRKKMEAVEIKRKQTLEYEAKKSQAFKFMDLAKKELNQNKFEKAIKFYKESEKIFAEINWVEGMKLIKDSINVITTKREKFELEKRLIRLKEEEKLRMEAQMKEQIAKAEDLQKLQQEQKRKEFMEIQRQKEQEKEVSEEAYKLLEDGADLMNNKKYDKAYEKYIMGRDLFQKLGWQHEVSRINNDLLFVLKKEMKQTEKVKAMQQKKLEEEKEIETLLKEAEIKRKELEEIRKKEKQKKREEFIEQELENVKNIIKDLKYNEAIWKLKKVIRKSGKLGKEKLIKQIEKQIEILENASQVPLITKEEIEKDEDIVKFELGYKALDRAQISLSENQFMKAISEFNEAIFNFRDTIIGLKYLPIISEKIDNYKKELGIKVSLEEEEIEEKVSEGENIRVKIAKRRAERKKKIQKILGK